MFPSLRLPMAGAAWRPGFGPRESEAWLAQEEARYAAKLQSIRCKAPAAQPIGFDAKVHGVELPAKEEEEQERTIRELEARLGLEPRSAEREERLEVEP